MENDVEILPNDIIISGERKFHVHSFNSKEKLLECSNADSSSTTTFKLPISSFGLNEYDEQQFIKEMEELCPGWFL